MKKSDDELRREIFKKVKPIFEKVLNENISDTMSVPPTVTFLWSPHNYRLKIPFYDKRTLPIKKKKFKFPMELKYSNYNSKVTTRINGITIMKEPSCIIAIYSKKEFGKDTWYKIECNTLRDIDLRINEKVSDIKNKCMDAIKVFIKNFGGRAYFEESKWIRHEDAVHGEDFLDSIPKDTIIHDTYFKKVYQDHVEFKSPTFMKNYISNRAVEKLAPEIAKEINSLNNNIMNNLAAYNESLKEYNENVKLHKEVQKKQLQTLKSMDKTLKAIRDEKTKRKKKISEFQTRLFT
jgi:hypothetical protein